MTTWLERRRERRRKRKRMEEIASWLILPLVLFFGWFIGSQLWALVREPATALLRGTDTTQPR